MSEASSSGLDGVVVADTALSDVDGERGRLVIAGSDVERLAATATFEVAASQVLVAGGLSSKHADIRAALTRARGAAWECLPRLGDALDAPDAMDALRAALAHLRSSADDAEDAIAAIGAAPIAARASARSSPVACR